MKLIELTRDDIQWAFDGRTGPHVRLGQRTWGMTHQVDPTPAYPHDAGLVQDLLDEIDQKFPLDVSVYVYILPVETPERTNAWTQHDSEYDPAGNGTWKPSIVLQGKRIPPHPAVTKYLIAHEYGHVVEEYLNIRRGNKLGDDTLIREYQQLRGIEPPSYYGAGTWHCSPGEVFANDFRILVMEREVEYWPHPGISRPEDCLAIVGWWTQILKELKREV